MATMIIKMVKKTGRWTSYDFARIPSKIAEFDSRDAAVAATIALATASVTRSLDIGLYPEHVVVTVNEVDGSKTQTITRDDVSDALLAKLGAGTATIRDPAIRAQISVITIPFVPSAR